MTSGNMALILLLLVCIFNLQFSIGQEDPQKTNPPFTAIAQGQICGKIVTSEKGREICAFRGIPYAKPPVNELRFKITTPAEPWQGVFKADTDETIPCPQVLNKKVIGTEDCLLLNVYTPLVHFSNTSKLPVMIYFHGGGLTKGSGMDKMYYPTLLLEKDIVLVTVNYRLGILGFVSTGDEVIPGNLGLFDQVEAMKWVQNNIGAFGGDAQKVTIFGQSAGAISVALHLVSPWSKNLFSGAIMQSGTTLGIRSISKNPRKWAKRLAMKLKCPSTTSQQLLECLRNKSTEELVTAPEYFYLVNELPKIFSAVVENRPEGFLPEQPVQVMSSKKMDVPVMIGITGEEGYYLYSAFQKYFDEEGEKFVKCDIPNIFQGFYEEDVERYVSNITGYYFAGISQNDYDSFKMALISLYSDFYVAEGTQRSLEILQNSKTETYAYKMTYRGDVCYSIYNCSNPGNRGLSHSEDVPFLFPVQNLTEKDSQVSETIIDLWTNFATYRNPTPNEYSSAFKWLPVTANEVRYLDINMTPKMVVGKLSENVEAWNEIGKARENCMET